VVLMLSRILDTVIVAGVLWGASHADSLPAIGDSVPSECEGDNAPGWPHGRVARLGGIRIEGSPEFITRIVSAINRARDIPSYRYIQNIRSITERDIPGRYAQIHLHNQAAEVNPTAVQRGCVFLAGVLVHEGAHVTYGANHFPVYAAQAQAYREMGATLAALESDISKYLIP
jgi:hypothetical protein